MRLVHRTVRRLALGLVCGLALPAAAQAAPADPTQLVELRQSDGTTILARAYGDEWSNGYETTSGYTIVRDGDDWEYAEVSDGELEPSGLTVGEDSPAGLDKHVRPEAPRVAQAAAPARPNTGTQRALVILVEFEDQASYGTTVEQWHERFFGESDSVRDYYDEASYGALAIEPAAESHGTANDGVVGWVTLPAHPGDVSQGKRDLAGAAIAAADPYVDYAAFDLDHNGTLTPDELHVTVIPAGGEASSNCTGVPVVWGHHWNVWNAPLVDGVRVGGYYGDGGSYTMFGEMHCTSGAPTHMATLGIMVHEIGHDLGMPDLYDTDGSSPYGGGVGAWSVMASGSWLSLPGQKAGSKPAGLDAFSRSYQGWLTPREITGDAPATTLAQTATNPDVVQLLENPAGVDWSFQKQSGTGEYYLLENRQKVGYDAALPACGVLVWHIDETRTSSNTANANDTRRLVQLKDADGDGITWADAGDPYKNGAVFSDALLYSGKPSGVIASAFSDCASTMTADLQVATGAPKATITSGPSGPTRDTDVSFAFSASGAVRFECRLDDGDWSACTSPAAFSGLADGTHTFRVQAFDGDDESDGVAERSFTVDTTGPTMTIVSGPSGLVNSRSVTFKLGAGEPGASVWCSLDSGSWHPCSGVASYSGLADGTHTFWVTAYDALGNLGPFVTRDFKVDATAPTTGIFGEAVSGTSASFTFGADEPASFACQLDGGAWTPCVSPVSYHSLGAGAHTFRVRATDTAGNRGTAVARGFTVSAPVDVPPPPVVEDVVVDTPQPLASPTVTDVRVKLSACAAKRGVCRKTATVSAKLSTASQMTARVELKRCVKKRCKWVKATTGQASTPVASAAAAKLSMRRLKPGTYRVVVTAVGPGGTSRPTTKTFTVRR